MQNNQNMKKGMFPYAMLLVIGLAIMFLYNMTNDMNKELTYNEFNKALNKNNIKEVVITPSTQAYTYQLTGTLRDAKKGETFSVKTPLSDTVIKQIVKASEKKDFKIVSKSDPTSSTWFMFLTNILPYLVLFGIAFWFFTKQLGGQKGSMDFGRSRAKLNPDKGKVTFKDVAGLPEEKEELQELIDFLKNPKKFTKLGARIPKGVLLVGPPGTGKTLLAKAIASEAGVPFFQVTGSSFEEKFVGVGAARVRSIFRKAKRAAPSIIFIDEIDAVARNRYEGRTYSEQSLNQMLAEMDGFDSDSHVIVIAATNHKEVLDPAILRAGRFDRHIHISLPNVKARAEILKVHAKNKKLSSDVNLEELARKTVGFSGAYLENILNEAALIAVRTNSNCITNEIIDEAIARVLVGIKKEESILSAEEKYLTAVHEAGHAIVSAVVRPNVKNFCISIVPRGEAGGYNFFDESYRTYNQKEEIKKQI